MKASIAWTIWASNKIGAPLFIPPGLRGERAPSDFGLPDDSRSFRGFRLLGDLRFPKHEQPMLNPQTLNPNRP